MLYANNQSFDFIRNDFVEGFFISTPTGNSTVTKKIKNRQLKNEPPVFYLFYSRLSSLDLPTHII